MRMHEKSYSVHVAEHGMYNPRVHMEGSNSLCKTESHTALAGQGPRPREYVTTCRRAESCGPTLLGPRIGPPSSSSSSHHAPRHRRQIGLRTYHSYHRLCPPSSLAPSQRSATRGRVDPRLLGRLTSHIAPRGARRAVILSPLRRALEKGSSPAQAATREARLSSRLWG